MSRKPPHKGRLNGSGYRSGFVKLDQGLLRTDAWRYLSPDALKVLLDIWARHNGMNNGYISYSHREARACLCDGTGKNVSHARVTAALRDIQAKGLAVVARDSKFTLKTKEARLWRLTAEACGEKEPTRDFRSWTGEERNTATAPVANGNSQSGHRPASNPDSGTHNNRDGCCNPRSSAEHGNSPSGISNIPGGGGSNDATASRAEPLHGEEEVNILRLRAIGRPA